MSERIQNAEPCRRCGAQPEARPGYGIVCVGKGSHNPTKGYGTIPRWNAAQRLGRIRAMQKDGR